MMQQERKFIELKVDNFTIKLCRGDNISHEEDVRRLSKYVSKICKFGQQQEIKSKQE